MKQKFLVLVLILNLSVIFFGKKIAVLEYVLKPGSIKVNKNKLFISERHSISIYNLETLQLETKFGKKGKGPGEFEMNPWLKFIDDSIFINDR